MPSCVHAVLWPIQLEGPGQALLLSSVESATGAARVQAALCRDNPNPWDLENIRPATQDTRTPTRRHPTTYVQATQGLTGTDGHAGKCAGVQGSEPFR